MQYVAADTETHVAAHAKPLVCLSLFGRELPTNPATARVVRGVAADSAHGWSALLTGAEAVEVYRALLLDPDITLVGHSMPFDLTITVEAAATLLRPEGTPGGRAPLPLLDETFAELQAGRIRCTMVREKLLTIALDPRGAPAYSLADLCSKYLDIDRSAEKDTIEKGAAEKCEACGGSGVGKRDGLGEPLVPPDWCPTCEGFGWVGPWRMRYVQLHGVPLDQWPADARRYALEDAETTLEVFEAQSDIDGYTPAGSVWADMRSENPAVAGPSLELTDEIKQTQRAFALELMTTWGVNVDGDAAAALKVEVGALVAEADVIGVAAGFVRDRNGIARLRPDKPGRPGSVCKAAQKVLILQAYGCSEELADGGGEAYYEWLKDRRLLTKKSKTYPSGQVKTDRDTLVGSGNIDLKAYGEAGHARTTLNTFLPQVERALAVGGPLTSRANVLVNTGRISWSKPNLTNPPRKGGFRECFVARPGWVFLTTDYDMAELCALAQINLWLGHGRTMADAIIAGRDLHVDFAAMQLGITYGEAWKRYKADDAEVSEARQLAKVANFGFMGGMGPDAFVSFASGMGVIIDPHRPTAVEKVRQLKYQWLDKWPEMRAYFAWIGRLSEDGFFTYKQWVSGRLRGGVGFCDGCNTGPQGLVADGAKQAAWNLARECYTGFKVDYNGDYLSDAEGAAEGRRVPSPLAGCRAWLFMHDEVLLEAPFRHDPERLTAAGRRMSQVMTEAMQVYTPDVPSRAETAAMLRWYKGAKPAHNAAGQLVPWAPRA